jgi:hypothetical protein
MTKGSFKPKEQKQNLLKQNGVVVMNTDQLGRVELTSNSKGVNVGVKAYHPDVEEAAKLAKKVFDNLRKDYKVGEN